LTENGYHIFWDSIPAWGVPRTAANPYFDAGAVDPFKYRLVFLGFRQTGVLD